MSADTGSMVAKQDDIPACSKIYFEVFDQMTVTLYGTYKFMVVI